MHALPSGQILHLDTTRPGPQNFDRSRSAGAPEEDNLSGDFHTTRWTLVLEARGTESEVSRRALSELCSSYWQPLFLFVVRRGAQWDEPRDLTQAFSFTGAGNGIRTRDPQLGKLMLYQLSYSRSTT